MDINELSPEQRAKAQACKTSEELVALAKEEGYALSTDQLEAIAAGSWNHWNDCEEVVIRSTGGACPGVTH